MMLCYGETVKTLARALGVSDEEGQVYYDGYFALYSGVLLYHEWAIEELKRVGEFRMICGGRKRRFHAQRRAIQKGRMTEKEIRKTMRDIVNNIPQGSASDVMKKGILAFMAKKRTMPELRECHPVLQVHDEIVMIVPLDKVDICLATAIPCFELTVKWRVPIIVGHVVCPTWDEGKG